MAEQNFENHRQLVTGYHYVLTAIVALSIIGAGWNIFRSLQRGEGRLEAFLGALIVIAIVLLGWYVRVFALKAQDRAIRAEENLRHFALTGSLLDSRLRMRQIVGLRFASDEEFPVLAKRAAEEGLSEDDVKKAIRSWRADTYRV